MTALKPPARRFHLTLCDSVKTKRVQHHTYTWPELIEAFSTPLVREDRRNTPFPLFVPAEMRTLEDGAKTQGFNLHGTLTPAYSRCDENVVAIHFLVLDIDNDPAPKGRDALPSCSVEEALQEVRGLQFLLYTSFNHLNPAKHGGVEKFRVLLPLERQVTKKDIKERLKALKELFPFADPAGFTFSQPFYVPIKHPELPFRFEASDPTDKTQRRFDILALPLDPIPAARKVTYEATGERVPATQIINTVQYGEIQAGDLFDLMVPNKSVSCYRLNDPTDRKPGCYVYKYETGICYFDNAGGKQFIPVLKAKRAVTGEALEELEEEAGALPPLQRRKRKEEAATEPREIVSIPLPLPPQHLLDDRPVVITINEADLKDHSDDIVRLAPKQGLLAIRSPKGTGKTKTLHPLIADNKRHNRSTLLIGHRINLLRATSANLGIDNYQDLTEGELSKYCVVCLNSLGIREPMHGDAYDTVIIDESEQVLQALDADHIREGDRNDIYLKLQHYISRARLVVLLDADLSSLSLASFRALRADYRNHFTHADDHLGIDNTHRYGVGRTTHLYEDRHQLLVDAVQQLSSGDRLFWATNSKARATTVAAVFSTVLNERDGLEVGKQHPAVLLVTSATAETPAVQALILNPQDEAPRYEVIVTSPTLNTGFSIEVEHFNRVYGDFSHNPGTFFDHDQALCRVRQNVPHHVFIQGNAAEVQPTSQSFHIDCEVDKILRDEFVKYDVQSKSAAHWIGFISHIRALASSWSTHKPRQFREYRANDGWTFVEHELDKTKRDLGKELIEDHADLHADHGKVLFEARELTWEEYEQLNTQQDGKPLTHDDRLALERFRYVERLEEAGIDVTVDALRQAVKEQLLKSVRHAFNYFLLSHEQRLERDRDSAELNSTTFTDIKHSAKVKQLVDVLTAAAGIDIEQLHEAARFEDVQVTAEQLAKLAAAFEEHKYDISLYFERRIRIADTNNPKHHKQVWDATLGAKALRLSKKKVQQGGVRKMHYFINAESQALYYEWYSKMKRLTK